MDHQKTEAKTRQDIIDKRLLKAGWKVDEPSQVTSELDIWVGLPTCNSRGKEDFKRCSNWARASIHYAISDGRQ
jgi:predicted type IV restriction endonuclease